MCIGGKVPNLAFAKSSVLVRNLKEHYSCCVVSEQLSTPLSRSPHLTEPHLLLTTTLKGGWNRNYHVHFSDEESQSKRSVTVTQQVD